MNDVMQDILIAHLRRKLALCEGALASLLENPTCDIPIPTRIRAEAEQALSFARTPEPNTSR